MHQGFYGEYESYSADNSQALAKHNKKGTKKIWVCGHSLGGAFAVLVMDATIADCIRLVNHE